MRYPVSFAQRRCGPSPAHGRCGRVAPVPRELARRPVDTVALQQAMTSWWPGMPRCGPASSAPTAGRNRSSRTPASPDRPHCPGDGAARAELLAVELAGARSTWRAAAAARRADRRGDQRSLFVLAAHRIIADTSHWRSCSTNCPCVPERAASLPPLWMTTATTPLAAERLRGEELSRQLDHWRVPLRTCRRTTTATDRP